MKKFLTIVVLFHVGILMLTGLSGCAKARNRWKSNGGFWASMGGGTMGDYVVISQSGGKIMDVWISRWEPTV